MLNIKEKKKIQDTTLETSVLQREIVFQIRRNNPCLMGTGLGSH